MSLPDPPREKGLSGEKIYSEKKLNFSTAAVSVNCTVYDAKNLAPVICFNEAGYCGELGGKANGDGFYQNKFQKSVVEKKTL